MPIRARHRSSPGTARALLLLSVAALVALVAGCGAPEYTYVTNSTDRTYLKVPTIVAADRRQGDERRDRLRPDADGGGARPVVRGLRRGRRAVADAPVRTERRGARGVRRRPADPGVRPRPVLARPAARPVLSRVAVGPGGRRDGPDVGASAISSLVSDEVLTPGNGLRGVHSVFRYRVGDGPMQMMDQTAYLNDDASKLYMFFVRCSTECYEQRQKEIGNVVSSFTVRETT